MIGACENRFGVVEIQNGGNAVPIANGPIANGMCRNSIPTYVAIPDIPSRSNFITSRNRMLFFRRRREL